MSKDDVNEAWATYLRRAMREAGYEPDGSRSGGRTRLAEDSGVSLPVISRSLNAGRTPDPTTLRHLARPLRKSYLELLVAAGHATKDDLPQAASGDDSPVPAKVDADVVTAIENDPDLLPEARAHLLNQYELLLRIQSAAPAALVRRQEERRHLAAVASSTNDEPAGAQTDEPRPLAYVARTRDGKPVVSDPETEARLAREIDEAVKANPHARKRRK